MEEPNAHAADDPLDPAFHLGDVTRRTPGRLEARDEIGQADGLVCGVNRSYSETLGPSLGVLKLNAGVRRVSGMYAIVFPDLFQEHRTLLQTVGVLVVEGPVQNQDGVIHVRARRFASLDAHVLASDLPPSHDFR